MVRLRFVREVLRNGAAAGQTGGGGEAEALATLTEAVETETPDVDALHALFVLHVRRNDLVTAERVLWRLRAVDPSRAAELEKHLKP